MRKCIFIFITKRGLTLLITIFAFLMVQSSIIQANLKKHHHENNILSNKIIVIDPGHGGIDSGTHYGEIVFEKHINLEVGLKLKEKMSSYANVILTREIDDSLDDHIKNGSRHREDLNARVQIINQNKADIFISIHCNFIRNSPSTLGPMVFYHSSSSRSKTLAEYIQESLNNLSAYKNHPKAQHSATPGNYVLLRETSPPGVIVEMGFLSNETDRTLLQQEEHQWDIVEFIYNGVQKYFNHIENNQ